MIATELQSPQRGSKQSAQGIALGTDKQRGVICCYGDWSSSTAQSGYMFYGCRALCGDKGTAYTDAVTDKTYARPDGGTGSPGYFTAETMTGISLTPDPSPGRGEIYNLAGQKMVNGKLSNGQLPRGIYIVGGRKVLR